MKGLIIKDLYCLRNSVKLFMFVVISVFIFSLMFALSTEFGNIHKELVKLETEQDPDASSAAEVIEVLKFALLIILLMPMAFTGNAVDLFLADHNASFLKLETALPVTPAKRVGARYISGMGFTFLGFLISALFVTILSFFTELIELEKNLKYLLMFAGIMLIFLSLLITLSYALGGEMAGLNTILSFIIMLAVLIIIKHDTIRKILMDEEDILDAARGSLGSAFLPICIATPVIVLISFLLNVRFFSKRDRRVRRKEKK